MCVPNQVSGYDLIVGHEPRFFPKLRLLNVDTAYLWPTNVKFPESTRRIPSRIKTRPESFPWMRWLGRGESSVLEGERAGNGQRLNLKHHGKVNSELQLLLDHRGIRYILLVWLPVKCCLVISLSFLPAVLTYCNCKPIPLCIIHHVPQDDTPVSGWSDFQLNPKPWGPLPLDNWCFRKFSLSFPSTSVAKFW